MKVKRAAMKRQRLQIAGADPKSGIGFKQQKRLDGFVIAGNRRSLTFYEVTYGKIPYRN
jgi:hypothetical protein